MGANTYDPKQHLLSFAGLLIPSGSYAPDTFITVEYDEDAYTKQTGAGGEVTRSKSNNKGGRITLTLMMGSQGNDLLSAIATADRLTGNGVVPVFGKDLNGTTSYAASDAWILRMPNIERAKESGNVEWVIDCANLEMFVGGLL